MTIAAHRHQGPSSASRARKWCVEAPFRVGMVSWIEDQASDSDTLTRARLAGEVTQALLMWSI